MSVEPEDLQIELENIPVDLIDPDPDNPNEIDEAMMEALSAEIDRGFVQPILVRPAGDRWKLVDGEHRWRLVTDKGYPTIPAVIDRSFADGQEGEDEAKVKLLTMNRLRGQFVPIKLAYVLADLTKRIPEDQLRKRLGMDAGELRDNLRLANFTDDVGERLRENIEREARDAPAVLTFVCANPQDAAAISRVVDALVGDDVDRGQALAAICRAYEKSKQP